MSEQQYFGYPQFDVKGEKVLTRSNGICADMLQDITVCRLASGVCKTWKSDTDEMAFVLVEGALEFEWDEGGENRREKAVRESFLTDGAYCLHVPRGIRVSLRAVGEKGFSEILVQATGNDTGFSSFFYTPENCREEVFGEGQFDGKARRSVRTFFDYHSAPYSNMVCGEIIVPQGGWSSYPPHWHPQPEVYYYRFSAPQGFGACFIGENAHVIKDGCFSAIPGGMTHPQVNAPGYAMYYVWMIRHLEGDPWTDRFFDEAHLWLR